MVVKQNSQYTFKYNKKLGRHGWLRLTPAYSVKMVEHILNDLDYTPQCLFEPFSGTGTTELVCANKGISSFAYDVNPFLVWLASTKTAFYTNVQILEFVEEYTHILSIVDGADEYAYPNIFHIERWWHKRQLSFLAKLKTCIWSVNDKVVADLLKVAFCREIIALSNAAFNHHLIFSYIKLLLILIPSRFSNFRVGYLFCNIETRSLAIASDLVCLYIAVL